MHYHKFLFFRLPCFLSSLSPCLVVALSFCSCVRTPADFSWRRGCVTPPYGNLDWRAPHFTITGVGVRVLGPLTNLYARYTRDCSSAVGSRNHAAKVRRNEATKVLLYIRRTYQPLRPTPTVHRNQLLTKHPTPSKFTHPPLDTHKTY